MIQWKAKGELYYVSKKITRRYSLPVGVRLGSVWRKMEIKNYLRTCGNENITLQRNQKTDVQHNRCGFSINFERTDCR